MTSNKFLGTTKVKKHSIFSMLRGQSATEFMILVGAMLFFFATFLSALYFNVGDRTREKVRVDFEQVALRVQDEFNLASGASDGYVRVFRVPETVQGRPYTLNITSETLYIKVGNEFAAAYPIPEIDGNLTFGMNNITKINGTVYLNHLP